MTTRLSVNVNKVALLRNSREGEVPSPLEAARIALDAGAHGITVHPRPDERHVRRSDVLPLAELVREAAGGVAGEVEYNIEGNPFLGDYLAIAGEAKPDQCTLVPDDPAQKTSDHGWDLKRDAGRVKPVVEHLKALGCRVSLFMDPVIEQIELAPATGADRIELYTEGYARAIAAGSPEADRVHEQYAAAARRAQELGLGVNGGHDLNLENLGRFVSIGGILEVSIGHALTADALLHHGLAEAVRRYLAAMGQ